ncbi:MAG: hypothetical protein Q9202_003005 [Teloschistes flavicans]
MSRSDSLKSLWDSRFDDSHDLSKSFSSAKTPQDEALKISSILAAARRDLQMINPQELQFYSHLGAGSCFNVECEVYTKSDDISVPQLAAVKYIKLSRRPGADTNLFYDGVMRELRVLTHPPFRNHECLIEAIGYGWSRSTEAGVHPYLVVEYSDHGTLADYLQRITPPVDQCRQLALDCAVGLQALHHSGIVHGDLKIDNVLVFDCAGERPQVAKLADFGASIFDVDFEDGFAKYRGTARYNAPEQEGRLGSHSWRNSQTREAFLKADVYSMGLLLWEAMNNGDDFCQAEWLDVDETDLQFLDRICEAETDGLLRRARTFCEYRFQHIDQPVIKNAVLDVLQGTLRDNVAQRVDIDTVIDGLAAGISIFEELKNQTKGQRMTAHSADANLQLSLCYHTGFGVEPDAAEALHCLRRAASLDSIARSIRRRLELACNDQALMDLGFATVIDEQMEILLDSPSYFSQRVRLHQKTLNTSTTRRIWECDTLRFSFSDSDLMDYGLRDHDCHQPCVSVDTPGVIARRDNLLDLAAELGRADLVQRLLNEFIWKDKERRSALIKACEYGHFAVAQLLTVCCPQLQNEANSPSPLHWLIMFTEDEARKMAALLEHAGAAGSESANGLSNNIINSMPAPGSEPQAFPEHCLELVGSPLHWAVGVRNLPVVTLLVELGADVHQRWSFTRLPENDHPNHRRPSFSPFELSIALHLPEIVKFLWNATSDARRADLLKSSTTFHCIAQVPLPFQRRMIHGASHARALDDTIGELQGLGFDIHRENPLGQSVFLSALADPDQELYVLEGLLAVSDPCGGITSDGMNALALVATTSSRRQYSLQRMSLAADIVTDINDTDSSGWNALHYLAVEDSFRLYEPLLQRQTLDINKPNAQGSTAVHIAATFDSCTVLKLLLHKGANIRVLDHDGYSPLALAVLHRRKGAIKTLLEASADIAISQKSDASATSILHIAVCGPSSSESIVGYILDTYPRFREPAQLNYVDGLGWTALHRAAYFGDHEGVASLLEYGADSEARCPRRFPIALGRTALDVALNLLQRIETKGTLSPDHALITKGGAQAIALFKLQLEEVKITLSRHSKLRSGYAPQDDLEDLDIDSRSTKTSETSISPL